MVILLFHIYTCNLYSSEVSVGNIRTFIQAPEAPRHLKTYIASLDTKLVILLNPYTDPTELLQYITWPPKLRALLLTLILNPRRISLSRSEFLRLERLLGICNILPKPPRPDLLSKHLIKFSWCPPVSSVCIIQHRESGLTWKYRG